MNPQEIATYLLSYFMCCIAMGGCALVLRCGLAGVVWSLSIQRPNQYLFIPSALSPSPNGQHRYFDQISGEMIEA